MNRYYRHVVGQRLVDLFDDADHGTALAWVESTVKRAPVVVVGAGFSRNAVNARTGLPASPKAVPLWNEILHLLAQDLNLDRNRYDALTLAQLYSTERGEAAFHRRLLEALPDDLLKPGPAHHALFKYRLRAVITTNLLDTLLDQGSSAWRTVVDDAALALLAEDEIELIYLHGHRQLRPSWVITRAQYEDIHRQKPVIVTKVRQLLAQHPVLIVGYSLSDPDFHQIYRYLGLEMSFRQPLGLALFPGDFPPSASERRYWETLGLRIAVFRKGKTPQQSFREFFELPQPSTASAKFVVRWPHGTGATIQPN